MSAAQIQPRLIRPVQEPLGLFIRVARGDSQCVQNFLEIKGAHFHGVVIDPTRTTLDKDVRDVAAKRKLDIVLDPKTQESAFDGSFTVKLGKLPWALAAGTSLKILKVRQESVGRAPSPNLSRKMGSPKF